MQSYLTSYAHIGFQGLHRGWILHSVCRRWGFFVCFFSATSIDFSRSPGVHVV